MTAQCPRCNSLNVETLDRARKAGGMVGFVGGAASGTAGAMSGARMGAALGLAGGPVGATLGGIAGAILGGLLGGTAGGITGTQLGKVIDDRLLDNYHCMNCNHTFNSEKAQHFKSNTQIEGL